MRKKSTQVSSSRVAIIVALGLVNVIARAITVRSVSSRPGLHVMCAEGLELSSAWQVAQAQKGYYVNAKGNVSHFVA